MSLNETGFDNAKVAVADIAGKGRGLVARRAIATAELIIRSPVTLLDPMEYQLLRVAPAIKSFAMRQPGYDDDNALQWFMFGMTRLFENPDQVLGPHAKNSGIEGTIMHTFSWPRVDEAGGDTAALAFGLSSLCNHAPEEELANAEIRRDPAGGYVDLVAVEDIAAGEEVLIRYTSVPFEAV